MKHFCARMICLSLLAILPFGCTSEVEEGPEDDGVPLYFEPISTGNRANISDTLELVIRDRESWIPVLDSLRPPTPIDSVDFQQAVLLLAALPQTTSGYSVEFTSVEERDTVVVAEYQVNAPADDCLTAHAEVVPFQVVLVRRTELPVRFERNVVEYRCTFGPRR